ncbi:pyridoxal phosphate-dependent aminotransferase [Ponticoccus sp. SC2-23]|uniref:pyridoxal phosphate-dependent aminotransferase n=1 Tax=Alexandriicola marinus TaxID=2081710 RepID=UPI000FDA6D77|nr:pyridoxal phosphate-dependent aminotransferase [Alexandriicola marinus]MBM1221783.1 pyridoxal phosphate-dependent aminotransferase [Ponticoccus sp. SC6-9]MBM1226134.1 pyridoxal phosphate-dependent aminotransferase [Ponticoccus sp. SC6-15]MBM1230730.1 pyridoxal phosphate-dependent aminotransferase [Ponticoccus sp. SC6-38]MBM1235429.1 pyridoxal phosphate-dependent aminotransferase [Ponticoccus sp. SC6-45]MBM1239752.1 pyridoxal phosphate-dependent aminotransferase [Ponticoccus sp. SC6-49]MBM1
MTDLHFAESLSRLGTESAFVVLARAGQLAAEGRDIINLGIGQPDFRTPEHIVEAGVKALRDGHHGYTPANGLPVLREAVAADLNTRHGVEVNPDNVVVVPGGKPTMFFAVMMFGEPGAEIMYPNPGFPIYESVIRYSGATPVPIALKEENGFAFSAEEVLAQITPRTRLIIINSPANPTGGVTPKDEIDKFVAGLADHPHVAVMSDEIYSQMLYGGRDHVSLLQYPEIRDRLIMLDGWSKTYAMTGWRLGYAVWPDACVDHVTRLCINDHSCVNASAQYAGLAALTGPQDEVRDMVAQFDKRREIIVRELNSLPGVRCADAAGAFYAFPNIECTGMTAMEAQNRFLDEAGVATVAGTSFGRFGEGYVRFSYANSAENILRAIERIRAIL